MNLDIEHIRYREWMGAALIGEIFGPSIRHRNWKQDLYDEAVPIEPAANMQFASWDDYGRRLVDKDSGQEILKDEAPSKRYGVGLLYPRESEDAALDEAPSEQTVAQEASAGINAALDDSNAAEKKSRKKCAEKAARLASLPGEDDLPGEDEGADALRLARLRKPRSMGITFVADTAAGPFLVRVEGGRYRRIPVVVKGTGDKKDSGREIWVRVPVEAALSLDLADGHLSQRKQLAVEPSDIPGLPPLDLQLDIRVRSLPSAFAQAYPATARLVTVTLVNQTQVGRSPDESILFQARFSVSPKEAAKEGLLPLPRLLNTADEEEESLHLLFRNVHAFATGHGCAGDWEAPEGGPWAQCVIAEPIPYHEVPPVTPDLIYPAGHHKAGQELNIFILPLARGEAGWLDPLSELSGLYEQWIQSKRTEAAALSPALQRAALRHLDVASVCLDRIRKGLKLLQDDTEAARAFQLANEAILLQQVAGRLPERGVSHDRQQNRFVWKKDLDTPTLDHSSAADRKWRPFQIAFLLMSLPGLWDGNDPDREIADLIWFPTGGGKTEAYLGVSAFYLVARRLKDKQDGGTGVLMRYTLRLLTSQQFQRASGLICALETIRLREMDDDGKLLLGATPFRIGLWVGGDTTPNTRKESCKAYHEAEEKGPTAYKHVLLRCPWCASQMGPIPDTSHRSHFICMGIRSTGRGEGRTIALHCPDTNCDFYNGLPVSVVDEEIYDDPPSLLIGTVDKFAMLAWRPAARALFGIDGEGNRSTSPPGLIIQDELHLITGPLGSMVGLYEGVIEELCTERRGARPVKPKLVASTATTRASTRQIRDLYAREGTAVFPPPGLDAGDSFFAMYDRHREGPDQGRIKPGRMYLGVLARAYGSGLTVNVRVLTALLAAAQLVPDDRRDPWHTLLVFYNALRELGAGLTLFGADIPERLGDLQRRWTPGKGPNGKPLKSRRYLNEILELTGRLDNSEVPRALASLEHKYADPRSGAVDACLASNIIEVGVDVPRLGLMAVSGQPKNTAQYIQATGRVGRDKPGLVVMMYDHRKARDLSHYEHFRDYHARLYARVEPSSVTPFTTQVLERALHGAFTAWVRNKVSWTEQSRPEHIHQDPMSESLEEFKDTFRERIRLLHQDDAEAAARALGLFEATMDRREKEWKARTQPGGLCLASCWDHLGHGGQMTDPASGDMPMLRQYGAPCKEQWLGLTWPTPTSMRGVDAECPASIFQPTAGETETTLSTPTSTT